MRYFVQSFSQRDGQLEEGFGQFLMDREQALLAAERIARTRAGVLVMAEECDLFGEAEGTMTPIAAFGRVPVGHGREPSAASALAA